MKLFGSMGSTPGLRWPVNWPARRGWAMTTSRG
jgi:hypothetical protein